MAGKRSGVSLGCFGASLLRVESRLVLKPSTCRQQQYHGVHTDFKQCHHVPPKHGAAAQSVAYRRIGAARAVHHAHIAR
jgi:hypothetical protein